MTYPRTLHLTDDGTPITVQRPTPRAVATAARAAVGHLTFGDMGCLPQWSPDATPIVWGLADWIARQLNLDEAATAEARRLAGRRGVPRG